MNVAIVILTEVLEFLISQQGQAITGDVVDIVKQILHRHLPGATVLPNGQIHVPSDG